MEDIRRRLAAFASEISASLDGVATVRQEDIGAMQWTSVEPLRADALAVYWMEYYDPEPKYSQLQVEAGHNGGRWELAADMESVQFIEDAVRSVVAGRVVETFGPGRSRVEITRSDGEVVTETGYSSPRGCLPIPGWIRRGRKVRYAAYG